MKKHLVVGAGVLVVCTAAFLQSRVVHADPATFTVTVAADTDDGTCDADCSLREAIDAANANDGVDTIDFDAALSGETIALADSLPDISEAAIIDGTALAERVTISGAGPGAVLNFNNADAGNVLKGIALSGHGYGVSAIGTTGIVIGGSAAGDGNVIDGYDDGGIYFVSDRNSFALGNVIGSTAGGNFGIKSISSTALTIGGTGANDKNVIVNNSNTGINISQVDGVSIRGNWIGTADGDTAAGNAQYGIAFDTSAAGVGIGGGAPGSRNIISGNGAGAIYMPIANADVVRIRGNYIGLNADGDAALPNGGGIVMNSVATIGGTDPGQGNVISGNNGTAIRIGEAGATGLDANPVGCTVQGNVIGLNPAGDTAIPNTPGYGIHIVNSNNVIGGTDPAARNLISASGWDGIYIWSEGDVVTGNQIIGNYIGTDADGSADMGNNGTGILIGTGVANTVVGGTDAGSGNVISGNFTQGILMTHESGSGNTVAQNVIGMSAGLDAAIANGSNGVEIWSDGNVVGGLTSDSRNVISGNTSLGVGLVSTASDNVVENNYIGTASGIDGFGNGLDGVYIDNTASNNQVGAAGAGNVIVANGRHGVSVVQTTGEDNVIQANYIGVDSTGDGDLGNGQTGIFNAGRGTLIGGSDAGEGNVVSGNGVIGIYLGGAGGATVEGNIVGLNADGDAAIPNDNDNIQVISDDNVIGGTTAGARNVVSGGGRVGVYLLGAAETENNVIQGNYIGLSADGTVAIPNADYPVDITFAGAANNTVGGTVAGAGNVISGGAFSAINVEGDSGGETIAGNIIGLDPTGTFAIPNNGAGIRMNSNNNTIGGTALAARNVVSGNVSAGIVLFGSSSGNTIEGNYVGIDAAGEAAVPNGGEGIVLSGELVTNNTVGGSVEGAHNVVSGNTTVGITLSANENTVAGNFIGTDEFGTAAIPNGTQGMLVTGMLNVIGGTVPGAGNVISGNLSMGVHVAGGAGGNVFQRNFIGPDATGMAALPNGDNGIYVTDTASNNFFGTSGNGNVLSGNNVAGLYLNSNLTVNNSVNGNIIGLAADGMTPMANTLFGFWANFSDGTRIGTAGDPDAVNTISGNGSVGIRLYGTTNSVVVNNRIGLATDGTTVRANNGAAVALEFGAESNVIGGTADGSGNVAAAPDASDCFFVNDDSGDFNSIRGNDCNESAAVTTIVVEDPANEGIDAPAITLSTTSRVSGTAVDGDVDLFVDGAYATSTTADGGVWSVDMAVAGDFVSASVTNGTDSTSSTSARAAVVPDVADPTVVSLSPADDADDVARDADLTIVFDESVTFGGGDIVIRKAQNDSVFETIPANDGDRVSGVGTATIVIDPSEDLRSGTDYYVQIDGTAFEDLSGNAFVGIADNTSWSFSASGSRGGGGGGGSSSATYAVSVSSPAGGETFSAGETRQVRWAVTSSAIVGFVNVSYSTDGISYVPIATNVSNVGSYDWHVPSGVNSASVTVRVQATDLALVLATGVSRAFTVGIPPTGATEPFSCASAGTPGSTAFPVTYDYFRGDSFDTVYYLNARGQRRPFPTSQTYFSWTPSFDRIRRVIDAVLPCYSIGIPVLPRPGRVLVKIVSDSNVYALESDPTNVDGTILRLVPDEATAIAVYGSDWADYVIDVDPTLFHHFVDGTAIDATYVVDLSKMRKREDLR